MTNKTNMNRSKMSTKNGCKEIDSRAKYQGEKALPQSDVTPIGDKRLKQHTKNPQLEANGRERIRH